MTRRGRMREAESHISARGQYLEALDDYQEVIEQAKAGEHQPRALMMSATIYGTFLKDHEAALKLYSQAREKYPGSVYEADAIFQTAMIQYERARYKEASRLFGLYLEKFPSGSSRDVASFMRDASDSPPAERERKSRELATRQRGQRTIRVLILEHAVEPACRALHPWRSGTRAGAPPPDHQRTAGGPGAVRGRCPVRQRESVSRHRTDGDPGKGGHGPGQRCRGTAVT